MRTIKAAVGTAKPEKRPPSEKEFTQVIDRALTAFNEATTLKKNDIRFAGAFNKTAPEKGEDGTNWGWSSYEYWGSVDVTLREGESKSFSVDVVFPQAGDQWYYLNALIKGPSQFWDEREAFCFRILDEE